MGKHNPRVTVAAKAWTWIEVKGEGDTRWREDGGLVSGLMRWMIDEGIEWRAQSTGGGMFIGRVPVEHTLKILEWLKKRGAKHVEAQ